MVEKRKNPGHLAAHSAPRQEELLVTDFERQAIAAGTRGDWQAAAQFYAQGMNQRSIELELISSVQEGLSSKYEMQAIYDLVGDKLRDTFNAQVVMISQYDPVSEKIFHHYAIERGQHLHIPGWHPIDVSRSKVIKNKKPVMINQDEINALLQRQNMKVVPGTEVPKTWLGVPMLVGREARGIVSLQNLDIENAFTSRDTALLSALTNSMSQSLDNARLFNETQRFLEQIEREMDLARQAQTSILPRHMPDHAQYDFGACIIPARAVGGDFYDFIPMDAQHHCIVIGDVSDKGLPAALFMAITISLLRSETGRHANARAILNNVNRNLLQMNPDMFVTLLYCVLEFETGVVEYSRAGHMPPLIMDPGGKFVDLSKDIGQPLSVFRHLRIDQQRIRIPSGGLALLYSDGLNEAYDGKETYFGLERVKQELYMHRNESADTICKQLRSAVEEHCGDNPQRDDFTTVVIKRL